VGHHVSLVRFQVVVVHHEQDGMSPRAIKGLKGLVPLVMGLVGAEEPFHPVFMQV